MLVLTLRLDEALRVGDDIRVSVRDIFRHAPTNTVQVRCAIEAPREVLVLRSELVNRPPPPERT